MFAIATSVTTRWFPTREVPRRVEPRPAARPDVVTLLRQGLATQLHRLADQLAGPAVAELDVPMVDDMMGPGTGGSEGIRNVV